MGISSSFSFFPPLPPDRFPLKKTLIMPQAILALEDGRTFTGESFGATGTSVGEACFNTSMTGYQEVLTDPSYRGQIVAMTYPLIGNYGTNEADNESDAPHVRGFVINELSTVASCYRNEKPLAEYLADNDIIGIQGVDTRALTKHLRTRGAMRAALTTEAKSVDEAIEMAKNSTGMEGSDFVKEVSTKSGYHWDPQGTQSGLWQIPNVSTGVTAERGPLPPVKHKIVAYDLGVKRNILRSLRQHGFDVDVVNAHTSAKDVLAKNPDGVFFSNGPGDPSALDYVHSEMRELIGKKPIFAICLGHQMLAHAMGGSTYKLKFGHRGGNQPVKDLRSGKVAITSQNHGFAVDGESLPAHVEITHINLNDNSVEGIRHRDEPAFSVQYHPEAAPGPHDASYFFNEFSDLIDSTK